MERREEHPAWRKDAVTIWREVALDPDAVFRAMTEPAELLSWWGGSGGLTRAHVNLRPGGEYRFDFQGPAGQTGWIKGQYHLVEPRKRISMTWFSSQHPALRNDVEIRFEPAGGATRVTVVHSGLAGQAEALKDYERIWSDTLDRLAAKRKGRP
jgi:uncharacterized protein YndB with AHSA1/START domain